jgi:two-component system sensor histidine kinase YesM
MASLNERTAQLAALEAQTNPHFLFNTLQAIATEAILAEDQKVYRMITTLAALLRYTIKGGNLIDLDTELKYVDKYLTLQKARFGERLQYAIDVDTALLGCSVPKLGLLALVENSIVHGMQGSVDAIRLTLECRDRGDMADIRVTDDGAGISEARLRQLRASMADETVVVMQNIGLGNLSSRLRLLYEGRARLEIESVAAPERRTTVRIRIPKEAAEDVHNADH